MKRLPRRAWVPVAWLVAVPAAAEPVTCEYGDLTRRVEVVYVDPGQPVPCEVIYDKAGEGSIATLWRASNESGYCESRAAALVQKLVGMGWDCAEASTPSGGTSDNQSPR